MLKNTTYNYNNSSNMPYSYSSSNLLPIQNNQRVNDKHGEMFKNVNIKSKIMASNSLRENQKQFSCDLGVKLENTRKMKINEALDDKNT